LLANSLGTFNSSSLLYLALKVPSSLRSNFGLVEKMLVAMFLTLKLITVLPI
jgi:hypothetical protein